MPMDWSGIGGSFERHPKLKMKVGDVANVTFKDDGNFVAADKFKQSDEMKKQKVKPKDSYVFVVDQGVEVNEFWLSTSNHSVLKQLKDIRDKNGNTLVGAKCKIERVSEDISETNYEITKL